MPVSLIETLNYGEADVSPLHFDATVRASFVGIEQNDIKKPKKDSNTIMVITWKLEEELTSLDGRKLAPGKSLRDRSFVNSTDPESVERWKAKGKRIMCRLNHLPLTHNGPLNWADQKGKEVLLRLSYTPGEDDPSDPEMGFDNFAYYDTEEKE